MAHTTHSHDHPVEHGGTSTARLAFVAGVNITFAIVQIIVGLALGSVVVLADALHQAVDAVGISTALVAVVLLRRPASLEMSYGWGRADALGGYTSGLLLLGSVVWVVYESIERLIDPIEVDGGGVIVIGLIGIIINGASVWALGNAGNLSIRAARLHMALDLAGSVIVVAAGLLLVGTNATRIDPAASLVVNVLVLWGTVGLLRASAGVLLDRVPDDASIEDVETALLDQDGVSSVHHVHMRSLGPGMRSLTAHVVLEGSPNLHDAQTRLNEIQHDLVNSLGIAHTTVQLECHECKDSDHDHTDNHQEAAS